MHLGQDRGEVLAQPRIGRMARGILVALAEQLVERELCRLSVVQRHTIGEGDKAGQIRAAHMLAMTADVHQGCIGSHRASVEVDLVVAHRLADLVEVLDEGRRGVLAQVIAPFQLPAAGAGRRRIEWRLEVAFQIVVRSERRTVQAMAIAGSPLIYQDRVVLVAITRVDPIVHNSVFVSPGPPARKKTGPWSGCGRSAGMSTIFKGSMRPWRVRRFSNTL